MGRTQRTLAAVAFTLVSCSSQILPAATPTTHVTTLRLYATTSAIPLIYNLTTTYTRLNPSITFEIAAGNYEAMVQEVLRDENAYLLTNHLDEDSALWAAPIGQDGIAVIVHPDNDISRLTTAQLRLVYQGWVTRWSDIGGRGGDMIVVSREDGSGARREFESLIMGSRRTTPTAQIAPSSESMVASVARQPDSIGYVSMSYLNDKRANERVRALALDGQHEPIAEEGLEPHYRAFIGWVQSPEGQALVADGYAPLLRPQ
jgi:phosphate transport system substrate-binding protein